MYHEVRLSDALRPSNALCDTHSWLQSSFSASHTRSTSSHHLSAHLALSQISPGETHVTLGRCSLCTTPLFHAAAPSCISSWTMMQILQFACQQRSHISTFERLDTHSAFHQPDGHGHQHSPPHIYLSSEQRENRARAHTFLPLDSEHVYCTLCIHCVLSINTRSRRRLPASRPLHRFLHLFGSIGGIHSIGSALPSLLLRRTTQYSVL